MKKVGIIRCRQTEHLCPGTTDIKLVAGGKGSFEPFGPCELVGFVSCGGCPGKEAVARAKMLVDRGAEVVALASCITKGSPLLVSHAPIAKTCLLPSGPNWAISRYSTIRTELTESGQPVVHGFQRCSKSLQKNVVQLSIAAPRFILLSEQN